MCYITGMQYKPIKTEFNYRQFKYKQIFREKDVAIYSQQEKDENSEFLDYEVIIIKTHNGYKIGGIEVEPSEIYPSDSQWGVYGWTYMTEDEARKKAGYLLRKSNVRQKIKKRAAKTVDRNNKVIYANSRKTNCFMTTEEQNQADQTQSDVINNENVATESSAPQVTEKRAATPRLKCIITGEERFTNRTYLAKKSQIAGGDVDRYLNHYISRKALKFLRMGKTVEEARHALNVSYSEEINQERLDSALKLNGKWSKNQD